MKILARDGGTIPLPPKNCQGEEPRRHACFQTVKACATGGNSAENFVLMLGCLASVLPKEGHYPPAIP